jgi:hypothetical protein
MLNKIKIFALLFPILLKICSTYECCSQMMNDLERDLSIYFEFSMDKQIDLSCNLNITSNLDPEKNYIQNEYDKSKFKISDEKESGLIRTRPKLFNQLNIFVRLL